MDNDEDDVMETGEQQQQVNFADQRTASLFSSNLGGTALISNNSSYTTVVISSPSTTAADLPLLLQPVVAGLSRMASSRSAQLSPSGDETRMHNKRKSSACDTASTSATSDSPPCIHSHKKPALRRCGGGGGVERVAVESAEHAPSAAAWVQQWTTWSADDQLDAFKQILAATPVARLDGMQDALRPYFQKDFIGHLPPEISIYIASLLPPKDLRRAASVSRAWRRVCEDRSIWERHCRQELQLSDLSTDRGALMPWPMKVRRGAWCRAALPELGVDEERGGEEHDEVVVVDAWSEADELRKGSYVLLERMWRRSRWLAHFVHHQRMLSNWARATGTQRRAVFRGHDDHVITCLQLHNEICLTGSDDNTLRVWSIPDGECLHTLTGHGGGVWTSQISADGQYAVSGSTDRTVRVWSTKTGRQLRVLTGHTSTVRCMALHGRTLVSGSRDATLRVWDIVTGTMLRRLDGHTAAVRCVAICADYIVSGSYDYTCKVWDARSYELLHTLIGHGNRVYSLVLSATRRIAASGSLDATIRLWDLQRGAVLHVLFGHTSLTSGIQITDEILVSANADATIRVWRISDGQCLWCLRGHESAVTSIQLVAGGRFLASSSDDGTARLWDLQTGESIRSLVELDSRGAGGCIWRLKATDSMLACAVGSRNGIEDTKLLLLDFSAC